MDRKKLERVIKGDSTAAMKARMVDAGDDLNVVWVDASDNAARVVCVLSRACPYEFAVDGDASTGHAAERVSLTVCGSLP